MHLPTIIHIELTMIKNFPFSGLTLYINLNRLDLFCLEFVMPLECDGFPEIFLIGISGFVVFVLQISPWRWGNCYMLNDGMDNQLSTSRTLNNSRCLLTGSKMKRMLDIYYRMPSILRDSTSMVCHPFFLVRRTGSNWALFISALWGFMIWFPRVHALKNALISRYSYLISGQFRLWGFARRKRWRDKT
jgi:hypothetical protein